MTEQVDTAGEEWDTFRRFESLVEVPMLVLSILFIPVIVMPLALDLSGQAERSLEFAGIVIWAAFIIEYVGMLYIAPKWRWVVRTHKADLLIVILPFLRPLRILRLVRLAGAGGAVARTGAALRRLGGRPGFSPFFGLFTLALFAGAGLTWVSEHEQPDSNIGDFGDALWWAVVTTTTVGYGDHFPVTASGRAVALVLMLFGIGALSMITANIAAFFVDRDSSEERTELEEVREQLNRIERLLLDGRE